MFSSNPARFSAIWELHDGKPFVQIQISHIIDCSDSQAAESRGIIFELNTCSPKIPNDLVQEIRVGTRFYLRVF